MPEIGPIETEVLSQVMKFHSDAVDDDVLRIVSLHGMESISKPYDFQLQLASTDRNLDLDELLKQPAHIEIKQGVRAAGGQSRGQTTVKIFGILSHIEQSGRELEWVKYRATLVPRLWKTGLAINSRVFQDVKVPDMVKRILDDYDIEIDDSKLSEDYPEREYIVQYEESDLAFIQRWLEHEGIYYYFKQDDEHEIVVLGDSPEGYGAMPGDSTFRFEPIQDDGTRGEAASSEAAAEDWFSEEIINSLTCIRKQLPKEVVLNDYNWRTPDDRLECKATVSEDGIGTVYEYNNHYKDNDEGSRLAEIRAEEINCREFEFQGTGDARGFRAGLVFSLRQPESDDERNRNGLNDGHYQDYLLVDVVHNASQSLALGTGGGSGASYSNSFLAIPKSKTFRPKCRTAWPSIKGVMHAVIDGEDDSTPYAQIDSMGRYKVRMPLDRGDAQEGDASRWIRKAEAYAGPDQGMHFPLLKGAEVLITHIDGDPDRPLIAAAVFNQKNETVVNEEHHHLNRIVTPGGNAFIIDDTVEATGITLHTNSEVNKFFMDGRVGIEKIEITNTGNLIKIDAGEQFIGFSCDVNSSFIRIGKKSDFSGDSANGKAGTADGIRIGTTGEYNLSTGGDAGIQIGGKEDKEVVGESKDKKLEGSWDWKIGDWVICNFAAKIENKVGATAGIQIGAELKIAYALTAEIKRSDGFEASWGHKIVFDKGGKTEIELQDRSLVVVRDKKLESKTGDVKISSLAQNVKIDAGLGITLECGASKIKMTPTEIKIMSPKIGIAGQQEAKIVSATKIDINSTGLLKCKGTPGGQYE